MLDKNRVSFMGLVSNNETAALGTICLPKKPENADLVKPSKSSDFDLCGERLVADEPRPHHNLTRLVELNPG